MTSPSTHPPVLAYAKKAVFVNSLIVVAIGLAALCGWMFEIDRLKRVLPEAVAMNPLTAICFILAGIVCGLLKPGRDRAWVKWLSGCLIAPMLGIALLRLGSYCFALPFELDRQLFPQALGQEPIRNSMAPNTAMNFLFVGMALGLMRFSRRHHPRVVQALGLTMFYVSLFAIIGYLFGVGSLTKFGEHLPMAFPTAVAFFLLALAVMLVYPDQGYLAFITVDSTAGSMARGLLPAAILLPLVLGWLLLQGERMGYYGTAFGSSLIAISTILILIHLIYFIANVLYRIDVRRQAAETLAHEYEIRALRETALRESEERFHGMVNSAPVLLWLTNAENQAVFFNRSWLEFTGRTLAMEQGRGWVEGVHPEEREGWVTEHEAAFQARHPLQMQYRLHHQAGSYRTVSESAVPRLGAQGEFLGFIGSITDITDYVKLQEQYQHAQKMEAIGRLAGGIAHDFNNLLLVINGYTELLLNAMPQDSAYRGDLLEICNAGERASELTRQMLAFGRKQIIKPQVLSPAAILRQMKNMFQRVIGEDIQLSFQLAENTGSVRMDPGQVEQIFMNLAANARDAMPQGGNLILETANIELDEAYARLHATVEPGHYVMLAVSDTGVGMDPETLKHIFEPFYTTKEVGKGTGLGMAMIYGIVKHAGGNVWVYSEPERGTTVKIYLPRVFDKPAASAAVAALPADLPGGTETILLVEDEESVRGLICGILQRCGYTVIESGIPQEAMHLCEHFKGVIHLLLSDVVMPGMSGRELAQRLAPMRPRMKVIFMSGYTENAIVDHGILDEDVNFLQKPFTPQTLARKLRQILD